MVNATELLGNIRGKTSNRAAKAVQGDGRENFLLLAEQALKSQIAQKKAAPPAPSTGLSQSRDLLDQAFQPTLQALSSTLRKPDMSAESAPGPRGGSSHSTALFLMANEPGRNIDQLQHLDWYINHDVKVGNWQDSSWQERFDNIKRDLTSKMRAAKFENAIPAAEIEAKYQAHIKQLDDYAQARAGGKDFGEPGYVRNLRVQHIQAGVAEARDPNWIPPELFMDIHYGPEGVTYRERPKA